MFDLPGITEMVFSARSTLKVLNAETFPRSTNSVTYLEFEIRRFMKLCKNIKQSINSGDLITGDNK